MIAARDGRSFASDAPYAPRWPPHRRAARVRPSRWAAGGDLGGEQLVVVDVGNVDERAERAAVFVVHRLVVEVGEVGLRPVALAAEAGRAPDVVNRSSSSNRRPRSSALRRSAARSSAGAGPARSLAVGAGAAPEAGGGARGRHVELARAVGGEREPGRRLRVGWGSRRGRGGSSRERLPLASTAACASSRAEDAHTLVRRSLRWARLRSRRARPKARPVARSGQLSPPRHRPGRPAVDLQTCA